MDKTEINIFLVLSFLIIITMITGLFYFVFQFRKRKIQEELENIKNIQTERERIIKDLHDELGGSLNSIQLLSNFILSNHLNHDKTLECVAKIADTSVLVAQQIKMVIWSLDTDKDSLLNLIEFTKIFIEQFLEPSNINLTFENNYTNNDIVINGYFRKNLFLTIKEITNNVVKHSKATRINYTISIINNQLVITIQDNGIGINSYNPFGNGLKNIQNRINSIHGIVTFENKNGTFISISIPL